MLRLVGAELHRFRLRILFWVAGVAIVGFVGVFLLQAYGEARPPSAAAVAEAQQYLAPAVQEWEQQYDSAQAEADAVQCLSDEADAKKTDPDADFGCDQMWAKPTIDQYLPYRSTYAQEAPGMVGNDAILLLLISLVVGISFITAETSTGALGNWLSFEPRRARVYASKATALATGVAVVSAVSLAVLGAGVRLVFAAFGRLGEATEAHRALVEATQTSGRVVLAAAAFALIGYALGVLVRHAAIAVGVLLVYLAACEGALRAAFPTVQRWLASTNVLAWVEGRYTYGVSTCERDPSTGYLSCDRWVEHTIYQRAGGWYLLAGTLVALALAWVVFRRRDVS